MRTGTDVRWQRLILGKAAATPRHQVRAHPVFASALSQLTCTRACFGCAQSCLVATCGTRAAVQELKVCTCHTLSPLPAHDRGHRVPSTCAHPAALLLRAGTYTHRRTHEAHTPMPARQADSRYKCVFPAILHAYVQKRRSQSVCTTIYEPWKGPDQAPRRVPRQPSFCPRKRVYRVKNRQFSLAHACRRSRKCVSCPRGARQKALGKPSKIVNFLRGAPPPPR